jgi:hypothetical protein
MKITKEYVIAMVIRFYGKCTRANINKAINVLNYEAQHLFNPNSPTDLLCIEVNYEIIGFLYSALRSMEYSINDTPLILN